MLIRLALLLLLTLPMFGQLDFNTLTVTVQRNYAVTPSEAILSVLVQTPLNTGIEDVLPLLQKPGLPAATLQSVNTSGGFEFTGSTQVITGNVLRPAPLLMWQFTIPVPLAQVGGALTTLTNLQRATESQKSTQTISFYVQGSQPSVRSTPPCSKVDLLQEARQEAQRLADTVAVAVGPILALTDVNTPTFVSTPYYFSTTGFTGNFLPAQRVTGLFFSTLANPAPSLPQCGLTAKFQLLR